MEQLESNLAVFAGSSGIKLSDDVIAKIDEVHNELRNPSLLD
jgi:aryl-alcohol dehydrogenase-like predicted oxidoreductase